MFTNVGYSYTKYKYKEYNEDGTGNIVDDDKELLRTVNVSLGIGREFNCFKDKKIIPYIGCTFWHTYGRYTYDGMDHPDPSNYDILEPFAGFNFLINKVVSLNFEGAYSGSDVSMTGSVSLQF